MVRRKHITTADDSSTSAVHNATLRISDIAVMRNATKRKTEYEKRVQKLVKDNFKSIVLKCESVRLKRKERIQKLI